MSDLEALEARVVECRRCPRLVEWREQVAREKRAAFADEEYWGRPVPGFGDPAARVFVLGLAPAAHGGNRTGRVFTGDRSGDWLFASLHRTRLRQPAEVRRPATTGCACGTAGWRRPCAARRPPTARRPQERDNCLPWTVDELELLPDAQVIVCLGAFAWDAGLRVRAALGEPVPRPKPRFGHGAELDGRWTLLGCFHPSQQNTFTGKLTEPMMDGVFARARLLAGLPPYPR